MRAIALTSGNAGHEVQCLGVIERLGFTPEIVHVKPSRFGRLIAPFGSPSLSFLGDLPDLVVAAGRLSIPFVRAIKKAKPSCVVVILQDPRCSVEWADVVWVNEHDKLRGDTVVVTLTSPHRLNDALLAKEALKLPDLPKPHIGVIIGGKSAVHSFDEADAREMALALKQLKGSLYITPSRRTGAKQIAVLKEELKTIPHFLWDMETGENPYFGILGKSDFLIVTSDSTNMLSESAFTGKPLFAYKMKGSAPKFESFYDALHKKGAMRWFEGSLEHFSYQKLDSTGEIVKRIKAKLEQ